MLTVSVAGRQMRGHHSVHQVGHSLCSRTQQRIRHHRPQPVMLRFQSVPKMCRRRRSMCRRICKPALLAGKSPCVVLCIQHTYMVPFIMEAVAAEDGCSVWLRCHLLAPWPAAVTCAAARTSPAGQACMLCLHMLRHRHICSML